MQYIFFFYFSCIGDALIGNSRVWTGLSDLHREGIWVWIDGRKARNPEVFWSAGEPNDANNNEDCGEIITSFYQINDNNCEKRFQGICEKKLN